MPERIVYYSDEAHDDFAGMNIRPKPVGAEFRFINDNPFWKAAAAVVYRLIATPVAWVVCHVVYGARIENRGVLRRLRRQKTGCFLFGNHTQSAFDAFFPSMLSFPRKCYIITGPEAISLPGLSQIVRMVGAIPLPDSVDGMRAFGAAVGRRVRERSAVAVYPEAHIWPYYTGLRNFSAGSFVYPVKCGVPAVAFAVTYRQRRIFKKLPPRIVVHVSEPFEPDPALPERRARMQLRDQVFSFMQAHICTPENYAHIRYVRRPEEAQDDHADTDAGRG